MGSVPDPLGGDPRLSKFTIAVYVGTGGDADFPWAIWRRGDQNREAGGADRCAQTAEFFCSLFFFFGRRGAAIPGLGGLLLTKSQTANKQKRNNTTPVLDPENGARGARDAADAARRPNVDVFVAQLLRQGRASRPGRRALNLREVARRKNRAFSYALGERL